MKTIHCKVPRAIYLAWKKYVDEECITHPEYNAVGVFCNLPEITQYLENPIMVIKKKARPNKKATSNITTLKYPYNHLNFMVPDEIYNAWYKYLQSKRMKNKNETTRSLFCALPEIQQRVVNYDEIMQKQRLRGRKPYFINSHSHKRL